MSIPVKQLRNFNSTDDTLVYNLPIREGTLALLEDIKIEYNNVAFVNPNIYIQDAEINNRYKTFSSIYDAVTALKNVGGNCLVYLIKGIYVDTIMLENNIDFYSEPGVIFSYSTITDQYNLNNNINCKFLGYSKFIYDYSSNLILNIRKNTNLYFECDEIIINNAYNYGMAFNGLDAKISINCNTITYKGPNNYPYLCLFSIRSNTDLIVNIKNMLFTNVAIATFQNVLQNNKVIINCPNAYVSCFVRNEYSYIITNNVQNEIYLEYNGNIHYDGLNNNIFLTYYVSILLIKYGTYIFNGNIYVKNTPNGYPIPVNNDTFGTNNNLALKSELYFNGNIINESGPSIVLLGNYSPNNNRKFVFNGDYESFSNNVLVTNGNMPIFFKNSTLKTKANNTNIISVNAIPTSITPNIHLFNCLLSGTGTGFTVNTPSPIEVSFHNTRSNLDNSPAITDALNPSGFIYDTNLILP